MSVELKDICPEFNGLETAAFKRKIYESCLLMTLDHYTNISSWYSENNFPANKYYTSKDFVKDMKPNKKIIDAPPKPKRIPVHKSNNNDSKHKNEDVPVVESVSMEDDTKTEETEKEKKQKKIYPIVFNRHAKTIIDFIISRFLWEMYTIDPTSGECPETKQDIENFVLKQILDNWTPNCNITQLIIHSVKIGQPNKHSTETHGLNKELRAKFSEHITNTNLTNYAVEYLTEFIRLIMLYFANRFWLEKSQTVNIKIFETVLRYIEILIPVDCKTISKGLINEIIQYDSIVNNPEKKSDDGKTEVKKGKCNKTANTKNDSDKTNIKNDAKKEVIVKPTKGKDSNDNNKKEVSVKPAKGKCKSSKAVDKKTTEVTETNKPDNKKSIPAIKSFKKLKLDSKSDEDSNDFDKYDEEEDEEEEDDE